jgi:hypothetical protein
MSATTSPTGSPNLIQPLHNPSQAAHVVVPKAPLGDVANRAPGMGAKALLARRMAENPSAAFAFVNPQTTWLILYFWISNPTYISPTDNLVTPCTQKLNAAKKKHFDKCVYWSTQVIGLLKWRPCHHLVRNQFNYFLGKSKIKISSAKRVGM